MYLVHFLYCAMLRIERGDATVSRLFVCLSILVSVCNVQVP